MAELRVVVRSELLPVEAGSLLALWERVWPDARGDVEVDRVRYFLDEANEHERLGEMLHLVWDGSVLLGAAKSFLREVAFVDSGARVQALALAGVCSDPDHRGHGFGRRVVRSVFERVGSSADICLFQTGVPRFYECLGASKVENEFVNSLSKDDPLARPWWDEHVMIYGDIEKWQEGRVDLLGAGY